MYLHTIELDSLGFNELVESYDHNSAPYILHSYFMHYTYIYMHVVTHMYTYMYICMTDGYMVLISMNVMFHDHFIVYRLSYTQLFDNFMAFSWDLSPPPHELQVFMDGS